MSFQVHEEVLARWDDDRWYYKGNIVSNENGKYEVRDLTDRVDHIMKENIIRIKDRKSSDDMCYVLAPHPAYPWSYAPGCVVERDVDKNSVTVRFYDGKESRYIRNSDVYPNSSHDKHWEDVKAIKEREKDWVGKDAIIRNDSTGCYEVGTVGGQLGKDQRYHVKLDDSCYREQRSIHIYGKYTRSHKFTENDYVLACCDPDQMKFLTGKVTEVQLSKDSVTVKFVNGKRRRNVSIDASYWLNNRSYKEAKEFYLKLNCKSPSEE